MTRTLRIGGQSVLFVLAASTAFSMFMVSQLCHIGALNPTVFHATGQCGASDPPSEVFWSFFVLGLIASSIATALVVLSMRRKIK